MKETKSRTKVTLTVSQNKKNRLRKFSSLVLKMMHLHHSGSPPWDIFILPKEKGQEVQENYVNHFPKKILMWVKSGIFGPEMINIFWISINSIL